MNFFLVVTWSPSFWNPELSPHATRLPLVLFSFPTLLFFCIVFSFSFVSSQFCPSGASHPPPLSESAFDEPAPQGWWRPAGPGCLRLLARLLPVFSFAVLGPGAAFSCFFPQCTLLARARQAKGSKMFFNFGQNVPSPFPLPSGRPFGSRRPPGSCCPVPSANRPSTLARPVWEAAESRCRPPTRSHVVAAAAGQCRARTTGFSETGRGETLCFGPASVPVCAPVASVSQLTSPIVPRGRRRHHRITSRLPGA